MTQDKIIINDFIKTNNELLAEENLDGVLNLVNKIRLLYGNTKNIWLYTGYSWGDLKITMNDVISYDEETEKFLQIQRKRQQIVKQCDVLVDGKYVDSLRNPALLYRGSENQRLIDVQKSIQSGKVVLWEV
jgi:anaerobic ribonucleoside-triphosphate reductase activating protein